MTYQKHSIRVWHKGLIFKLKQYGISDDLLNWLTDYLVDRQQSVIIKSYTSNYKTVSAGVPQASVLGPLLFLIYINDVADSLLSLTRLFADDRLTRCVSLENLYNI